ncbi:AAA family ATPase [Bosea sp. BIWAKO-01]|uniref:AAA family ATPase n=1 Tax=Bosea sp. BIWAKO-01 TaxID=506668 RepID=UPI0008693484|nr:AAA family ATPase [Bosea sp. BIWAKO-01]GAU82924.1 ATP-dependent protease domain protein [Bosea sp. BIWAKO-01]
MSDLDDFKAQIEVGLTRTAAEADTDDPYVKLPRLLRLAFSTIRFGRSIRERIAGEIREAAPELAPQLAAWLSTNSDRACANLVKKLDALSVKEDEPLLRALANCVLMIGVTPFDKHRDQQSRVALAFKLAVDSLQTDVPLNIRAQAARLAIGWAIIAGGAFTTARSSRAIDLVLAMANAAVDAVVDDARAEAFGEAQADQEAAVSEAKDSLTGNAAFAGAASLTPVPLGHVLVCGALAKASTSKTRDIMKGHEHIIGKPVPLVPTPDLTVVRDELVFEFPYAASLIDRVLADLIGREFVQLRPFVLVGEPGSGKSRFVRRLGETMGVMVWRTSAAAADGAAFGGTERRWHSSEPAHPFLAISRAQHANPIAMIDELEKAATRTDNGRLWDVLLTFLETETAGRFLDPALQIECDLSHVSIVATANSVAPLPSPLRDRMRVLQFPTPQAIHLDALLAPIMAELMIERRRDPNWIQPLSYDERDALSAHWKGGSVRQLRRLIETVLAAREAIAVRH